MIPLAVFLVACAIAYLAVVETAFGLLMRLPERLEAERESAADGLAAYLEDPLKFFVPARLLRGILLILAVVLMVQPIGTGWGPGVMVFLLSTGLVLIAAHLVPARVVRRAPERLLATLLPPFTAMANVVTPFTSLIVGWLGTPESHAPKGNGHGTPSPTQQTEGAATA